MGGSLVPFVVLGHERSGSSMLASVLSQHPDVKMLGELFHPSADERRAAARGREVYDDVGDGAAYLRRVFDRGTWDWPLAMGFKLFYHHARRGTARSIWATLESESALRILHVRRRDVLGAFVSREVARKTGQWMLLEGDRPAPPAGPFVADPGDFLVFAREISSARRELRRRIDARRVLELSYEDDLCRGFARTRVRICEHLGLDDCELSPLTLRQSRRALSEQIVNFAELDSAAREHDDDAGD